MLGGGRGSESGNVIAAMGHAMACEYARGGGGGLEVVDW